MTGLAPLVALLAVLWVFIGIPARHRQRREERRHHGGRKVRNARFFGLPKRDRAIEPGLVLLALACVQLAQVIIDVAPALVSTAISLAVVVLIGLVFSPRLTQAGMGLVGLVSLTLERFGASACESGATAGQNVMWVLSAVIVLVLIGVVSLFVSPIRSAGRRVRRSRGSFWLAAGDRYPNRSGSSPLLLAFGVLELTNFVLRPTTDTVVPDLLDPRHFLLAVIVVMSAIVILGLCILPQFTLSLVGIGTGLADIALVPLTKSGCPNPVVLLLVVLLLWLGGLLLQLVK